MISSYTVMVFQREMRTGNFQHWRITTERFMTDSIIPLYMTSVAHLWIYPPLPLMVYPACIKYPAIPQICSQMPYLLSWKILLVILPPLLISQISFLLVIVILTMLWIWMWLSEVGCIEDNAVVNTIKNYSTKGKGSIAPHALTRTQNFTIFMFFTG